MIHTSRQLKALVRDLSKGNSTKTQIIIRNYVMERFLERLSLSPYRDNLILKGGRPIYFRFLIKSIRHWMTLRKNCKQPMAILM